MSIVDLAVAARNLNVRLEDDGEVVREMLRRVEALVLAHLEREPYDDEAAPAGVQQAVLLALNEAYENRGNDPLTPAVIAELRPFRSPGVF